ncbi:butyrophilin subfamily 1 member A1-like isoform X2 [Polypterus senegalus]|uniref:butyrophilin subfamily 1 member A1-like isoform X2 n=1 Tax=Polypterus senegalus TaxID=55291 RepID=UPI0019624CA9|nr:butyrophilin subfamily 1 member A1-like isoform X2 [Polypterus senegalus]
MRKKPVCGICKMSHPFRKLDSWIVLIAILASVPPILAFDFTCVPDTVRNPVNTTAELHCSLTNIQIKGPITVVWTKDSIVLKKYQNSSRLRRDALNSRYHLLEDDIKHGKIILQITNTELSDDGIYECTVIVNEAYREALVRLFITDRVKEKTDADHKVQALVKFSHLKEDYQEDGGHRRHRNIIPTVFICFGFMAGACAVIVMKKTIFMARK